MKRWTMMAALALAGLTTACGSNEQTLTTTNDGNVVLNESQDNFAFRGDGEMTNDMAMEAAMSNDMAAGGMAMDSGAMTTANGTAGNMQ